MPNIEAAKKSLRADAKKRVFNDRRRRAMREAVKDVKKTAVTSIEAAAEKLSTAYKTIDKAVKRGVMKKNTGSRKKSQLAKLVAKK